VAATALSLGQLVIAGRVILAGKSKRLPQKRVSVSTVCGWRRQARRGGHGSGVNGGGAPQMVHKHDAGDIVPAQPGPAAFANIQEFVGIFGADPKTDWLVEGKYRKPSPASYRQQLRHPRRGREGRAAGEWGGADRVAAANTFNELRGLGFIGMTSRDIHHQEHGLMVARGQNPHQ